jgi:O-antigen/teichoic acid export membrane protein
MRLATSTLILVASQAAYNGRIAVEQILMGRWFSDDGLAPYFVAIGLAGLFEVGVHWGGQHMVNREAAARFEHLNERLGGLFASSLLTTVLVFLGIAATKGPALGVIAACVLLRAGSTLLGGICIGRGHIGPPTTARLLAAAVGIGGFLVIVRPDPTLERLAIALGIATVAYVTPLVIGSLRLGVHLVSPPSAWLPVWRDLAGRLWPFFLLFFCGQLLYRVDAPLLERLTDVATVGRFSYAFKWIEGFFFLPYVVASAAIPVLVRAARDEGADTARRILGRVAGLLAGGTLVITLALLVAGEPLLAWLVGETFVDSAPLFRLFVWLLPVHSLGILFVAGLVRQGSERVALGITLAAALAGVGGKLAGFAVAGIDGFSAGLFVGVILQAALAGIFLWRRPAPDTDAA